MLEILGLSLLSGAVAAGMKSRKKNDLRSRIVDILLACGVVTKTNKQVLFPKVVAVDKKPYGKRIIIRLPDGYPSDVIIHKWWVAIEEALGQEIAIEFDNFLYIDVFEKKTPTMISYEYEDRSDWKVAIGANEKGEKYIDLANEHPNYLIGGTPGSGKSVFLRVLLTTLALRKNKPDLYLADLKGGIELFMFKDLVCTKGFVTDLLQLKNMLENLYEEMAQRLDYLRINQMVKWRGKRIVFVMDEMIDLYEIKGDSKGNKLKSEIKKLLAELGAKGRAAGVILFLCTQRPDRNIVNGLMKTTMNNKICFRVVNGVQSEIVLDHGLAADLPQIPGRCIIQQDKDEILQVYYLSDNEARELLKEVERRERDITPSQDHALEEDTFELTRIGLSDH